MTEDIVAQLLSDRCYSYPAKRPCVRGTPCRCDKEQEAADEIERLRAKSVLWQPIETAPKDATSVLVYGIWDGELNACEDHPDVWKAHFSGDEWWVDGGEYYSQHVITPTHWMPLPEMPKDELRNAAPSDYARGFNDGRWRMQLIARTAIALGKEETK